MIYEVTQPGWLAPGWYIAGREYLGPYDTREEAEVIAVCPACDGNGLDGSVACGVCGGTGEIERWQWPHPLPPKH